MVDLGKRLLEAAKQGLTEEVRTLMSNGAPFTTDWLGTSPLHFSALNGHLGTSEVLLRAGISRDARTKVDRTPLHAASQEGHLEIVELLVRNGADMDAKDMLKMTPLHWAVERGHPVVIEFLLEQGAEVSCQNKFEKSPIDIAIGNGRADLAQILQQNVVEVSTSADDHPFVGEVTEVSAADAETMAATQSVTQSVQGHTFINTSTKKGESTEVLATLAALAEATSANSMSDGTATSPGTDSDTLKWLESQGITMISDNSTIVANTVENGQQLTLTEAGRLALNQIVKHKVPEGIGTIVSRHNIEHPMADTIVYSASTHTESEEDEGPSIKRIKLEKQTNVGDLEEGHLEEGHLEEVTSDLTQGVTGLDDMDIKLEGEVTHVYGGESVTAVYGGEGEEEAEYEVVEEYVSESQTETDGL